MAPKFKLWSPGTPEISGVPGRSKKQKFIFSPYLQKLFNKNCRQMAREIKAPHNKKKKKKKKKNNNNNNNKNKNNLKLS